MFDAWVAGSRGGSDISSTCVHEDANREEQGIHPARKLISAGAREPGPMGRALPEIIFCPLIYLRPRTEKVSFSAMPLKSGKCHA